MCGRKVVVSDAVKREIDASPTTALVCEQCELLDSGISVAESQADSAVNPEETCGTCARLKEQVEAAALEAARLSNLKDASAHDAHRKWAHLAEARVQHRRKAHGSERRGEH